MDKYYIKIILESEAIFNSGEEEQNLVNEKVLSDENGFVYFHAKTLKGQLRKTATWLNKKIEIFGTNNISFNRCIKRLFGSNFNLGKEQRAIMTLSNLELHKELKDYFMNINKYGDADEYYSITPYDMIQAQTNIRPRIQLEEGVAEDKKMMTYHTVKDGLEFYCEVKFLEEVSEEEVEALNLVVKSLNSIGASTKRGRGKIRASLLDSNYKQVVTKGLEVFISE